MVGPEFFDDLKRADCSIETLSVRSIRVFDHLKQGIYKILKSYT